MLMRMVFQLLYCICAVGPVGSIPINEAERRFFTSQLDSVRANGAYIHMVEFGGPDGLIVPGFADHDAIISWSVVTDDRDEAAVISYEHKDSRRVSVKHIAADYSIWGGVPDQDQESEGTLAEFDAYVSEIVYFGARDKAAYWVADLGRARVDVGIAALPLLSKTNGVLIVNGWTSTACNAASLSQFYDVLEVEESLAVLKPKAVSDLQKILDNGSKYDWCFSWDKDKKVLNTKNGPSDTGSVLQILQSNAVGCSDISHGEFYCNKDGTSCLRCYAALMAISNRGQWIKQSLKKVIKDSHDMGRLKPEELL